ncbi:MAG: hypothetical protein QF593_05955, partial [Nitrospinota bacterium]|nr:hypothetical protein [Nitrospinota bacterium]
YRGVDYVCFTAGGVGPSGMRPGRCARRSDRVRRRRCGHAIALRKDPMPIFHLSHLDQSKRI